MRWLGIVHLAIGFAISGRVVDAGKMHLHRQRMSASPFLPGGVQRLANRRRRRESVGSQHHNFVLVRGGGSGNAVTKLANYISESKQRCWIVLLLAIASEIGSTAITKFAADTSNASLMGVAVSLYFVSFILFAASLKQIDVSVAYAVWAALGTAMISVIGMLFFGEKFDAIKVLCVVSIVSGVVGLNLR